MKILIVEGSKIVRENLIRYLALENLFEEVLEAETVKEAKMVMQINIIDVILLEIQLPDASGLELMLQIRKMPQQPIMILCSNYKLPQYINIYENMSINHFFNKSSELTELKLFIKKLVMDIRNLSNIKSKTKFKLN